MKLWKRFLAWLHYLRHPATIITMDEAPAKGVQIKFSYTGGEYERLIHFDKTKAIADVLVERHKTGKSLRRAIDWREDGTEH